MVFIRTLAILPCSENRSHFALRDEATFAALILTALSRFAGSNAGQFEVERLESTCTVLGLFEDWHCDVAECNLSSGDTLVLHTDSVTEAAPSDGKECGAGPTA
jgi:serine phosphatase RsbU (regulator of sigma subunit)